MSPSASARPWRPASAIWRDECQGRGDLRGAPPIRHLLKVRKVFCTCQSLHWPQEHDCSWGGTFVANSHAHAVITPLRTLAQRCKRFMPLLAAPAALLLSQGQAKAVLTYNIFESKGDAIAQASGSLNLPAPIGSDQCFADGAISSGDAIICTGPNAVLNL